jgi:hypothetical protein
MPETPSDIGARAEREVAFALGRAGWDVFLPLFSAHGRVDMVALREGVVLRVQCKTARLVNGVLSFRTCSNTRNSPRDYLGQVDAFGVYSPDMGSTYLIPLDGLGGRGCHLRLGPAANKQVRGVRYARDYEVRSSPMTV